MDQFSPVIVNTTHHNIHFLNQVKGEIPICGPIDPKTLNNHDFCYSCSKHVTDLLFVKLMIRDRIN